MFAVLCRDAIQLSCRRADNRRYRVVPFVPGRGAAGTPRHPVDASHAVAGVDSRPLSQGDDPRSSRSGLIGRRGSSVRDGVRHDRPNPVTKTETLVARGIYRIDSNAPSGRQLFQLYPPAWHFPAGHIPKLELLGQDSGQIPADYTRPSNGVFSIEV